MQLRMVLLVLGLCSLSLSAQTPPRVLEVPYVQFTLANGLTVILHRDTSVPVVSIVRTTSGLQTSSLAAPVLRICSSI